MLMVLKDPTVLKVHKVVKEDAHQMVFKELLVLKVLKVLSVHKVLKEDKEFKA